MKIAKMWKWKDLTISKCEMSNSENGKMTKRKLTIWQNYKITKRKDDRMTKRENKKMLRL